MRTGYRLNKFGAALLLSSVLLCTGISANAAVQQSRQRPNHKASRKKAVDPPPPLPSGPTGRPVPAMPLDSMAAVPPQVSYENNQLTIVAPNSTLADILRAVRKQTGAEIEVPSAPERVVTNLGPGPARDVIAELLNGSRFNYVLLGSASDDAGLTRVVLVAKNAAQAVAASTASPPPGIPVPQNQAQAVVDQPEPDAGAAEAGEADAADDNGNADDNADQQQTEAEQQQQQPTPPEQQNAIKTPQQMLQEMQQRQMQMQQMQPPNQPPIPGSGMQPHPPQEN